MEEEQTPAFVWGFDSHISASAIFDLFDRKRETSLASVTLHNAMHNSVRRATLMYRNRYEAETISAAVNERRYLIDHGNLHMSLESFPEAILGVSNQMTIPGVEGTVPCYELFPNVPFQLTTSNHYPGAASYMPQQQQQQQGSTSLTTHYPGPASYMPQQQQLQGSTSLTTHYPGAASYMPQQQGSTSELTHYPQQQQGLTSGIIHYPGASYMPQGVVYVGNLPSTTTEGQVRVLFTEHGHVKEASVIKKTTDECFGIVKFTFPECATEAINHRDGSTFEGRVLRVRQWKNNNRVGFERRTVCYVSNFRYELDEGTLSNLFAQFGVVSSCTIRRDRQTGRSKGDAFVEFDTPEAAAKALELNGRYIQGRIMYVSFAKAKVVVMAGQGSRSEAL